LLDAPLAVVSINFLLVVKRGMEHLSNLRVFKSFSAEPRWGEEKPQRGPTLKVVYS